MRRLRTIFTVALTLVLATLGLLTSTTAQALAQAPTPPPPNPGAVEYRVPDAFPRAAALDAAGLDIVKRDGNDLFVIGDDGTGALLSKLGFPAQVSKRYAAVDTAAPQAQATPSAAPQDETYYGGYHTVNAHYANMAAAATAHPDLATVVNYGQSWRKQQGQGGYDLRAICITKKSGSDCALSPNSAKPRFILQAQIHAREIATGELAYKYINYLVSGYGSNTTVTNLLNTTEIWVVPIVNPDGVDIVQRGGNSPVLHRKNADFTSTDLQRCGDSASSQPGVDNNRNFGYHWQSNTSLCDQTRSTSNGASDSEPETKALEQLWTQLFGDHRADGAADVPDASARGTGLMLHSYAGLIIMPWEYTSSTHTPSDTQLRAMGRVMSGYTGYKYGQAGELLYNAPGGSDDYAYGRLGLASFTIELGASGSCDGFTPPYSCVNSTFWPPMLNVFNYLASKAPSPYK